MRIPTLGDLHDEATWLEWRALVPAAVQVSEMVSTADTRAEFLEGARLLRLDVRRRAGDGQPGPAPVQLVIADVLNAGRKFNGILEPRRSTKTTAVEALILGRCSMRDDYLVGWTLAKKDGGTKVSERFRKDIVTHVERLYPDSKQRPFILNTGRGTEHIRWPNGSFFNAYAPQNEAFTSGGFDIAWVDEAQDADPDLGDSLMTSIPPTLDGRYSYTEDGRRFGGQMIGTGTAPDYQDTNLLWRLLHMDRAGTLRHGIPQDTDPEELEAWEPDAEHPAAHVRELIELHHPGIGFTTPIDDVRDNFDAMSSTAFAREYLSLPGEEGSKTALVPAPLWEASRKSMGDAKPPRDVTAIALAVHPDGVWASLAIAWKVGEVRHVLLLAHFDGVNGVGKEVVKAQRKYRRQIVFDGKSAPAVVELAPLHAARPPLRSRALGTSDIARATVLMLKLLKTRQLVHYDGQAPLDAAAEIAVKRRMGDSGSFAFGRPDVRNEPEADITPLEACSMALYALDDERPEGRALEIVAT